MVDLALVGARVRTLDPERPAAEAIAIAGGEILAVGSDAEIRELGAATETIDLHDAAVVPGLPTATSIRCKAPWTRVAPTSATCRHSTTFAMWSQSSGGAARRASGCSASVSNTTFSVTAASAVTCSRTSSRDRRRS